MNHAIKQMEWAFKEIYKFSSKIPIRTHINIGERQNSLIMPVFLPSSQYFIVKIVNIRSDKIPSIVGVINVFDVNSGDLIAIMDGGSITQMRTGAASGLATRYLSNEDSKDLILFGTGSQALYQIDAVLEVRDISFIGVVGSSAKKSNSFSKIIKNNYSIECSPIKSSEIPGNSIICTATTSQLPVFSDEQIPPGCHINAIGSYQPSSREIPSSTILRSKIVVDHLKMCILEAGDLIIPKEEKIWSFENIYCEIGELVLGLAPSRENKKEITLFKSVGNAVQDLAIVNYIMRKL